MGIIGCLSYGSGPSFLSAHARLEALISIGACRGTGPMLAAKARAKPVEVWKRFIRIDGVLGQPLWARATADRGPRTSWKSVTVDRSPSGNQ